QSADRIEATPAIRKGADTGQHNTLGAAHQIGIARHADRCIKPRFAGRALECLLGRVQIAGPVIDNGNSHRDAPGCGNSPMISEAGAGTATEGAGGRTDGVRGECRIHASKKRRSAASRSSPTTTPTFVQRRCAKATRRNVAASNPINKCKMRLAANLTPEEALMAESPTWSRIAIPR